nr:hypothetical protein [Micromonospora sp. DSM 115978]
MSMLRPPWVPVVAPAPLPPADEPVTVWLDTGSTSGLEILIPADERWRLWDSGSGYCLLIDQDGREDATAALILNRVRQTWGPGAVDPDEQDVP